MDCRQIRDNLGLLLDGELPPTRSESVRAHIAECPACRTEWEQLQALESCLGGNDPAAGAHAPKELWPSIERRLDQRRPPRIFQLFHGPMALAASFALLIGVGLLFTFAIDRGAQPAQAGVVDYSILMNGIAADVHGAIDRFLKHYHAEPVDAAKAGLSAPELSFAVPDRLDGGFERVQTYRMRFGQSPGVAATYERAGEPLFVIFHPVSDNPARPSGRSCKIGELHGSQVQVGPWRLLHVMDGTTCHCVLTTLEPGPELEGVVRAVAPDLPNAAHHDHAPAHAH
jgi:hypothetical protein